MTTSTIQLSKKIQKLVLTKSGKVHTNYFKALSDSRIEGNKIYPKTWGGSGRHISLNDKSFYIRNILNVCGYKINTGNDAPRGGKEGDYFKLSSQAMKVIKDILNYNNQ